MNAWSCRAFHQHLILQYGFHFSVIGFVISCRNPPSLSLWLSFFPVLEFFWLNWILDWIFSCDKCNSFVQSCQRSSAARPPLPVCVSWQPLPNLPTWSGWHLQDTELRPIHLVSCLSFIQQFSLHFCSVHLIFPDILPGQ
jgi:hypothetical protein